jgi:hypothetical protein
MELRTTRAANNYVNNYGKNAETCRLITTTKRSIINKKRCVDGTNSNKNKKHIIIIITIISYNTQNTTHVGCITILNM